MSLELFFTVFGVIFVAELPDKTALATLVLATRHKALPVFLGSSLALSVQSIIAVGAGSLLSKLPGQYVHIGSGILFLGCAVLMWIRKPEKEDGEDKPELPFWRSLSTTFGVVFIAEWGDLTQIGTAAFEAQYHAWVTVMVASVLALWCVSAIAVFIGNKAGKLLDPKITQKVAALLFAVVGALLLYSAF